MNDDILDQLPVEHLQAIAEGNLDALPTEVLELIANAPAPEAPSGLARGLADPVTGLSQMLYEALPGGVQEFGESIQKSLHGLAPGVFKPSNPEGYSAQLAQEEQAYQQAREAAGETGIDWARMGGNVVSPANLMAASRLAKLAPASKFGQAAAIGGGSAAMQPVTTGGDFLTEKAKQVGLGTATGLGTQAVGSGIARMIKPKRSEDVMALTREGISPTPGQALGGLAGNIEEKAMSIPLLGNMIQAGRGRAFNQLTTGAYNRVLGPIGKKMPDKKMQGEDAIQYLEDTLGKEYDKIVPDLKGGFDAAFMHDLSQLRNMAARMGSDKVRRFERVVQEDVLDQATNFGRFSGETWKKMESNLGHEYRKFAKSLDPDDQEYAQAIKELQSELRQLQGRINPRHAKKLANINRGWANYDLVARASAYQGALQRGGQLTPANLSSASKAKDFSVNKRATAKGTALMRDLVGPAQRVLGPQVPDSGTAGRLMTGALMAGAAGGGAPIMPALAPLVGLSMPYLPFLQGGVTRAMMSRPQAAQPIAQGLRAATPFLAPGVNPLTQGLLGNF